MRLGVPKYVGGLAEVVKNPRFSTAVGLLVLGKQQAQRNGFKAMQGASFGGLIERMKTWFQGNF